MSGPKESMPKGWELVGSRIDMDVPTDTGRYLGCDHVQELPVKLAVQDHPFAHFIRQVPSRSRRQGGRSCGEDSILLED